MEDDNPSLDMDHKLHVLNFNIDYNYNIFNSYLKLKVQNCFRVISCNLIEVVN